MQAMLISSLVLQRISESLQWLVHAQPIMAKYYIIFPSSFAHDQDAIVSPIFINQFSWVFPFLILK
jgi:hypothetical protein